MTYKKTLPEDILSEFPKKYRDFLAKEIDILYLDIVGVLYLYITWQYALLCYRATGVT